jgi:hypothetical protein
MIKLRRVFIENINNLPHPQEANLDEEGAGVTSFKPTTNDSPALVNMALIHPGKC